MIARYYSTDQEKIACNLLGETDPIHPPAFKFLNSPVVYRRVESQEPGMDRCRKCAFMHERMLCNAAPRCGSNDEVIVFRDDVWKKYGHTNSFCYFVAEIEVVQYEGATVENMEI